jgi:hypothetical protein
MITRQLAAEFETYPIRLPVKSKGIVVVPSQGRDRLTQVLFVLNLETSEVTRVEIDMEDVATEGCSLTGTTPDAIPFGIPEPRQWQSFCLGPHAVTSADGDRLKIGLRCFNRFVEVELNACRASLLDPGVDDCFLTAMNWIATSDGASWFGSWTMRYPPQRMSTPDFPVEAAVWRSGLGTNVPEQVWRGRLGDFLHQIAVSVDGRYLVLTQLGMYAARPAPPGHPGSHASEWRAFAKAGVQPSDVLVLDLRAGTEWRVRPQIGSPAHVEFDPVHIRRCYVVCHNVVLVGAANVLMGPAAVFAYEFDESVPRLDAVFTADDFHRATSLVPFIHRGNPVLAVTSFPHQVFLIDAGTMKLRRRIALFSAESARTQDQPVFCNHDDRSPFSLAPSANGETLFVAGSGLLYTIDVATGRLVDDPIRFSRDGDQETVTGHLKLIPRGSQISHDA